MPRVVANGVTLHYQQAGEGPDLVLIHGVTGDLSSWYLRVMPALARDFRVVAYDLRGHGYSDMPPRGYTSVDLAADLDALLDHLGIEHAHLLGHSYGGTIALQCAALYPARVASLILAEPWLAALMPLLDLHTWPYLEANRMSLESQGLNIPDDKLFDVEYMARELLHLKLGIGLRGGAERSSRRLLRLLDTTTALAEAAAVSGLTVERMREIRQPVLAVYGEISPLLQLADHLAGALPSCQVQILAGVSHYFALSRPEMLVDVSRDFLRSLARPAAISADHVPDGRNGR
jgi:pimeloyl-ACP methyl ester carboxylesterase